MMRSIVASSLLALAAFGMRAEASDWPQWRGPTRDGVAPDSLPETLPSELRQLWRVEVGTGHASPIVVDGTVYVHSREGQAEVVRALDFDDGSELWRQSTETRFTRNPGALKHGKGPKSTPVAAGDSLCVFSINGRLTCLDRRSGTVAWQQDFSERFGRTWPNFGTAMSPIIVGDRLIAHIGGVDAGALTAFDLETGRELWSREEDPPAYASPVVVEIDGVEQVVTQTRQHLVAVSPDSGELLWRTPFKTPHAQNSVTPLVVGSRVIVSGLDRGTTAYEPRRDTRGNWLLEAVWSSPEWSMHMSSPVALDGLLFGLADKRKGQLFCLDLETGEQRWSSEGREGNNASLILSGGRLVVLTTEAELRIGSVDDKPWRPEATYTVAESEIWAHPALLDGRLVTKDKTAVAVWSLAPVD